MADISQQLSERYANVSSLYGPGTVTCWYLTMLSVLLSWTLHPKKRKSGSVDADVIAILTLPIVAGGHFISQMSNLMHYHEKLSDADANITQYIQAIAAIEAPFNIIESFMPISVVLFLVAVWTSCLSRALFMATTGLVCLAIECYVYFSSFRELDIRYQPSNAESDKGLTLSRSFVADFTSLIIAILGILYVCTIMTSAIATYMLQLDRHAELSRELESYSRTIEAGLPNARPTEFTLARSSKTEPAFRKCKRDERAMRTITWVSIIFLPATIPLCMLPSVLNCVSFGYSVFVTSGKAVPFWSHLKAFASHFLPSSSASFTDLDQAVATAAGATILGFNICGLIKAQYMKQISQTRHQ